MMRWTAVVPLKGAAERKTRLAPALDAAQRRELSDELYCHVVRSIAETQLIGEIIAITPTLPEAGVPVRLWAQQESSLNAELERIRATTAGPLMVVNADLPLIQPHYLITLAETAEQYGCAVAPDRHGTGTNAVALLPDVPFAFSFGPRSLKLHLASARDPWVVSSIGLGHDVDTLADIEDVLTFEALLPSDVARLLRATRDKGGVALAAGD